MNTRSNPLLNKLGIMALYRGKNTDELAYLGILEGYMSIGYLIIPLDDINLSYWQMGSETGAPCFSDENEVRRHILNHADSLLVCDPMGIIDREAWEWIDYAEEHSVIVQYTEDYSEEIEAVIQKVCDRSVDIFNRRIRIPKDGYPLSFSSFDVLSGMFQECGLDEILPGLRDHMDEVFGMAVEGLGHDDSVMLGNHFPDPDRRNAVIMEQFVERMNANYESESYQYRCYVMDRPTYVAGNLYLTASTHGGPLTEDVIIGNIGRMMQLQYERDGEDCNWKDVRENATWFYYENYDRIWQMVGKADVLRRVRDLESFWEDLEGMPFSSWQLYELPSVEWD